MFEPKKERESTAHTGGGKELVRRKTAKGKKERYRLKSTAARCNNLF
jgi:hypothetical protein